MLFSLEHLLTATLTYIIIMDPWGNIPIFLSALKNVPETRRRFIILRESIIAFAVIALFLFVGQYILSLFQISEPALGIAGGLILLIVAIKMIFPQTNHDHVVSEKEEPFIVPLAIPMLAGPALLASVMLSATRDPEYILTWFVAIVISSILSTIILLFSDSLQKLLGVKIIVALERLMGMLLTALSVQMLLSGIKEFFQLNPNL